MKRVFCIPLGLLLCIAFACRSHVPEPAEGGKPTVEADVAAVKTLVDEWARLYNARDFDRLMSVFYTEDGVLMAPGVPAIIGKDALLRSYLRDDKLNIEHVETSVVEDIRVSGDLAVARGRDTGATTPRSGGKPIPYDLKWLMAFVRQPDGAWKCVWEMWNENPLPGTPQKARQD